MQEEENRKLRTVPFNELDLNYMIIKTKWGSDELSSGLKESLKRKKLKKIPAGSPYLDNEGNPQTSDGSVYMVEEAELWSLLEYYTQDLRLGNLSDLKGELAFCNHYLNLAGDLLNERMIESFIIALSRVASVLELSQSKRGFLRNNLNTQRFKQHSTTEERPRRNLFGMSRKSKTYQED